MKRFVKKQNILKSLIISGVTIVAVVVIIHLIHTAVPYILKAHGM